MKTKLASDLEEKFDVLDTSISENSSKSKP
jgi:hypothetical protein